MKPTPCDFDRFFAGAEIHDGQVVAHFVRPIALATAPAFEAFVVQDCTRRIAASRHGHDRFAGTKIHDGQVRAHLARIVTEIDRVARSETADPIVAPALDETIVQLCADVGPTRGHLGDCRRRGARTRDAVARIPHIAGAGSRAGRIRARRIHVATAIVRRAFVDVRADESIARVSRIADANVARARSIRTAIGARAARVDFAHPRAITHGIGAFVVRVRHIGDEAASAVPATSLLDGRTGITRSTAMVVAAEPVDAVVRQALRRRRAGQAIVLPASSTTVTRAIDAFIIGIGIVFDRSASATDSLALFGCRTSLANASARGVAADAVRAIARRALPCRTARRSVGQVRRCIAGSDSITFGIHAFIVGIGRGDDVAAHAIGSLAFLRERTRLTRSRASGLAAHAVDAEARHTIRRNRATSTVRLLQLGLIASVAAAAFARIAFVVRVATADDGPADAVEAVAFFRRRACLARTSAYVAAAKSVGAIIRETLTGRGARRAVVKTTHAFAITPSNIAFAVRIEFGPDQTANSIRATAFLRRGTRLARSSTCGIATDAVDAITRRALPARYAHRSIGLWSLRLIAGAGAATFARVAFVVGISSARNGSADAIEALAFSSLRARKTHAGADVAAAESVNAIVGQTLRSGAARNAIVLLAHALTITSAHPAFFVGVLVVRNVAASPVRSASFFYSRTGLARA